MKYDRNTKKWVTDEEYQGKLGKRKLCRGGRPHDFVMTLPWGFEAVEGKYNGNAEEAYILEEKVEKYRQTLLDNMEVESGIKMKKMWSPRLTSYRTYTCAVCGKTTHGGDKTPNESQ